MDMEVEVEVECVWVDEWGAKRRSPSEENRREVGRGRRKRDGHVEHHVRHTWNKALVSADCLFFLKSLNASPAPSVCRSICGVVIETSGGGGS